MLNRDEIMQEAVRGTECTPEWVAMQTARLYLEYTLQGYDHEDALLAARREIGSINDEALNIRRSKPNRGVWREHIAPWLVIIGGVIVAVWWWFLWV